MDSLIFSVNLVLPSFLLIILGRLITLKNLIAKSEMDKITKLAFTYLMSTKIFYEVVETNSGDFSEFPMILYCCVALVILALTVWPIASKTLKRKESVGAFVQSSFRGSFTLLGLPMVESYAGAEGVARCSFLVALITVVYNILAGVVLNQNNGEIKGIKRVWPIVKGILKNPLVIASLLGMLIGYFHVQLPVVVKKTLGSLASMAVPLSLLCVGSNLDFQTVRNNFKESMLAAAIKTCFSPLVIVPVAVLLGFRGIDLFTITVFSTAANPSVGYVMALATNNDSALAASGIVMSTLLSVFSTTAFVFLLRVQGLI